MHWWSPPPPPVHLFSAVFQTVTITAIARARAAPRCIKSCVVTGRHASTPIVTSATQRGCSASTRTSAVYRKGNAHFGIQVVSAPPSFNPLLLLGQSEFADTYADDADPSSLPFQSCRRGVLVTTDCSVTPPPLCHIPPNVVPLGRRNHHSRCISSLVRGICYEQSRWSTMCPSFTWHPYLHSFVMIH